MQVGIIGLWHLGSVTAACVAEHFPTIAYDPDSTTIHQLSAGCPPIREPQLPELIQNGMRSGRLRFSNDLPETIRQCDIIWVTFDTPVGENDQADVDFVRRQIEAMFPFLLKGSLVLVSSQVPVGFMREIEVSFDKTFPGREVTFVYSPENLRLGKALDAFRHPERILVGVRQDCDRSRLQSLFSPFCNRLEWMSVESAEMSKHALNAFLATSITFINEIAILCERVGADAKEVERGLKSEPRIGPGAYLNPGSAYSGGTLGRDIGFLSRVGLQHRLPVHLIDAVAVSNEQHKTWPMSTLKDLWGDLRGKIVAVLGLTYKPRTDTLRRSASVELCMRLAQQGSLIRAYDPALQSLPPELSRSIQLCLSPLEALHQSDAALIATEWPEFQQLSPEDFVSMMRTTLILDPNRFLEAHLGKDSRLRYIAIGRIREFHET